MEHGPCTVPQVVGGNSLRDHLRWWAPDSSYRRFIPEPEVVEMIWFSYANTDINIVAHTQRCIGRGDRIRKFVKGPTLLLSEWTPAHRLVHPCDMIAKRHGRLFSNRPLGMQVPLGVGSRDWISRLCKETHMLGNAE